MSLYETGVRAIIDEFLLEESKKTRSYGDYWSASSAGYCMRKLIFERLGVPKTKDDDARLQRVFTAGHIFHEWMQGLTKKAGCSVAQEGELKNEGIAVKGHFDDLILVQKPVKKVIDNGEDSHPRYTEDTDDKLILYDYKTANSRSFDYKKELSHFHKMQLGTYMYMLRNAFESGGSLVVDGKALLTSMSGIVGVEDLTEARILILEKDTLRTKEFVLEWSPQLEKEIVGYWRTLNGYWKNRKMPKCTCDKYESGFMAKEKFNPYYYNGEPCSIEWYQRWKAENDPDKS